MNIRTLTEAIFSSPMLSRSRLANIAGRTFGGKRDLYKALGWARELSVHDYRSRFDRNSVANRVVKALPLSTWRGGAELIEDEDPSKSTAFEDAFAKLNKRLSLWSRMLKADIQAGIGRYSVIYLGAPGPIDQPLTKCGPNDLKYLMSYSEDEAKIAEFDIDPESERFGLPVFYTLTRPVTSSPEATGTTGVGKRVHWTRIIHVADGTLDDNVYGEPRLKCIWNDLDDLEKIRGGGAEAFWKRADGGTQFDLDPEIDFDDEADPDTVVPTNAVKTTGMKGQIEEYEHGLRRNLLTRGVTVNRLGSDVADFASPVGSIISLISAGTGIPQRVLMGSEQGKLAAKMDRSNWDDRVSDRRADFAGPHVVRPLIDRLVSLGVLPAPLTGEYEVRWPQLKILDDEQRAMIAGEWAALNQAAGEVVVTADEIRDRVLGLEPLTPEQKASTVVPTTPGPAKPPKVMTRGKWRVLTAEQRSYYLRVLGSPDQPRDDKGQWTSGGSGGAVSQLTVFHGGLSPEDVRAPVTYFTTNKDMAESYVQMSNDRFGSGGSLHETKIDIKAPAPWSVIEDEAKRVGIDNEFYTPASIFDRELHGNHEVSTLVRNLRSEGYDGAVLEDIAYGKQISEHVYIVFNPKFRGAGSPDQPRDDHGRWTNGSPSTAADKSGRTPSDAPLKAFTGYHVTTKENAAAILKSGFDISKVTAQWQNDKAISLSVGHKTATEYFSKGAPGEQKIFNGDKYTVLEVKGKGRLEPSDHVGQRSRSGSADDYRRQLLGEGYDGQHLGNILYIHNPSAIHSIREIGPHRSVKLKGAAAAPAWKAIHVAADAHLAPLTAAVSAAFAAGHSAVDRTNLKTALAKKNEAGVMEHVSRAITATELKLKSSVPAVLHATLTAAGTGTTPAFLATLEPKGPRHLRAAELQFTFDGTNPRATAWAKEHAGELIDGVSQTTREAIRELVERAFDEQFDVDALADQIDDLIGDEDRADEIARTETIRAANAGQQELWSQAVDDGLLTGDEEQVWIVTPDDKLCPVCDDLDETLAPLDGTFSTDDGDVDGPPAHPNCRCAVGLVPPEAE